MDWNVHMDKLKAKIAEFRQFSLRRREKRMADSTFIIVPAVRIDGQEYSNIRITTGSSVVGNKITGWVTLQSEGVVFPHLSEVTYLIWEGQISISDTPYPGNQNNYLNFRGYIVHDFTTVLIELRFHQDYTAWKPVWKNLMEKCGTPVEDSDPDSPINH